MKNALRQAACMLCLVFFIFVLLSSLVYAHEGVFVEGDENILPLLTHTRYFKDKPLIFFKDQLDTSLLEKVDAIVMSDSTQNDIIFKLMKWIDLKQGRNEVFISDEGLYGLFISREQILKKKIGYFLVTFNQKQFFVESERLSLTDELVKIKQFLLKKGKNIIKIECGEEEAFFVLGAKNDYLAIDHKLKNKEFCYIFKKRKGTFYIY
ncbi:MAG: hypothetical protein ABIC68_00850 [Candidatus Omnitrophota bacterium]